MDVLYHRDGILCNAQTTTYPARFEADDPEIIIVDIVSQEGNRTRYKQNKVCFGDLNRKITVGKLKYVCTFSHAFTQSTAFLFIASYRYKLRGVINYKPGNFVVTFIDEQNKIYVFDDLTGIEEVSRSVDGVETGIYTLIKEF